MPLPIGLLVGGALSAGVGAAQAISGARKSEMQKQNEERLRRLQAMEGKGQLGQLSGMEQRAFGSELGRLQQAAGASRTRSEALMAASGGASGADLARLRQEQAQQEAAAGQQVAQGERMRMMEKERAQRAEMAQREAAAEEARLARRQAALSGLAQAAGGAGALAGAVPEALRVAGIAGAPIRDTAALEQRLTQMGVDLDTQRAIMAIPPDRLTTVLRAVTEGRISTPEEAQLAEALQRDLSLAQGVGFGNTPQANPFSLSEGF